MKQVQYTACRILKQGQHRVNSLFNSDRRCRFGRLLLGTYTNESGRTAVRQNMPRTPIVYQDGTYSEKHELQPVPLERRAVQSHQADHAEHGERGQHW